MAKDRLLLMLATIGCAACIDTSDLLFDRTTTAVASAGAGGDGAGGAGSGGTSGRTYYDVVMEDGPLAYWRLGESGMTSIAVDASGHDLDALYYAGDGTIAIGQPGAIANDPDTAASVSATAYIFLDPHPLSFAGLAPYTLEAWIRKDPIDAGGDVLSCTGGDGAGYQTFILGSGVFHKRRNPPSSDIDEVSSENAAMVSFRHVVVTFDGSEGQLFLDAVPVNGMSTVFDTPIPTHAGAFMVADSGTQTLVVDEPAVYDHALPIDRIEAHYQCGKNGVCD